MKKKLKGIFASATREIEKRIISKNGKIYLYTEWERLPIDDIVYIETTPEPKQEKRKRVRLFCKKTKRFYYTRFTLKELEVFPFVRVAKHCIINSNAISGLRGKNFVFLTEEKIKIKVTEVYQGNLQRVISKRNKVYWKEKKRKEGE